MPIICGANIFVFVLHQSDNARIYVPVLLVLELDDECKIIKNKTL